MDHDAGDCADPLGDALAGIAVLRASQSDGGGMVAGGSRGSSSSSNSSKMGQSSSSSTSSTSSVGAALSRARLTFAASSTKSSSASISPLPMAQDIVTYRALLYDLLVNVIPGRKKTARGRYDKYDTARKDYASNVALPNLDYGKFPSNEDDRVLFMLWNGGDTPKGASKGALGRFADKYHRDPRKGKEALSLEEQHAIFAAASANLDSFVTVEKPCRGAPIRYRFNQSAGKDKWDGFPGAVGLEGKTLHEAMNRRLKLKKGTCATGLDFVKWLCRPSFNWNSSLFPKHVLLYHELVFLQSEGWFCYDGSGYWSVVVPAKATEAYNQWRQKEVQGTPSADSDVDSDAVLLARVGACGGQIKTHAESEAFARRFMVDDTVAATVAEVPPDDDADGDYGKGDLTSPLQSRDVGT